MPPQLDIRPAGKLGFTLIELSIVLVILGLLVGGILAGKSLIRSAELKSINNEYERYRTAVHTFRDKYFYYPGDMPNATQFWGAEADCVGYVWDATPKTLTCNGNGDGLVYHLAKPNSSGVVNGASVSANFPESHEVFRAWQHMANAGIVEGQYVGRTNGFPAMSYPYVAEFGLNLPKGRIPKSGWAFVYYKDVRLALIMYAPKNYGHVLVFSSKGTGVPGMWNGGIVEPQEAYTIDLKFDDGLPFSGLITTKTEAIIVSSSCVSNTILALATYHTTNTGNNCMLIFDVP
jgi:prepilin-type N-terminal cleavage/methylation domain-containing protein